MRDPKIVVPDHDVTEAELATALELEPFCQECGMDGLALRLAREVHRRRIPRSTTNAGQYRVRIEETTIVGGGVVHEAIVDRALDDPFIRTTIQPHGFWSAIAVLFRRYTIAVRVEGSDAAHRAIFGSDYSDPDGPPVFLAVDDATVREGIRKMGEAIDAKFMHDAAVLGIVPEATAARAKAIREARWGTDPGMNDVIDLAPDGTLSDPLKGGES